MRKASWIVVGLGAWVAASPWILGFASVNLARWGNVLAGGLVLLVGLSLTSRDNDI